MDFKLLFNYWVNVYLTQNIAISNFQYQFNKWLVVKLDDNVFIVNEL